MSLYHTKVEWVPWWRPLPLVRLKPDRLLEQIGWVWRQRAFLVRNVNLGWVAFEHDQTAENLIERCSECGKPKEPKP